MCLSGIQHDVHTSITQAGTLETFSEEVSALGGHFHKYIRAFAQSPT